MRSTLKIITLAAIHFGFVLPLLKAEPSKPNIVLILADDLGYGDLGCYGATKVKTPNIDKLAREGRRFTDAHSASSVCTPSRYAMLTGEYPFRKNLWGPVMNPSPLVLDVNRPTLASLLKEQGYHTACFGKWHLGFGDKEKPDWNEDLKPGPLECGFDHYFGIPVVSSHPPFVWVEDHRVVGLDPADPLTYGGKGETQMFPEKMFRPPMSGAKAAHALYREEEHGTTLTEKTTNWMRGHKDEPFFVYLATPHIHHPFTPGAKFKGSSEAGRYGDFIQELDWMVGEVMRTLDELKQRDNTLVILTSDNGGMLNEGGQQAFELGHRLNGDLLGFKFDAWEGGHRVPFIAHWPGHIPAGSVSDQLICQVDFVATFAALTGSKVSGPDSLNVLPALIGTPDKPVRDQLVIAPNKEKNLTLGEGRWLYIGAQGGGGFNGSKPGDHLLGGPAALAFTGETNSDIVDGKIRSDAPEAQLYDLEADRSQSRNIILEHPEQAKLMAKHLAELQQQPQSTPALSFESTTEEKAAANRTAVYSPANGIGPQDGVMRRDPSDIIRVGDLYYVWYSKGPQASGYDATVWYATSPDGHQWTEQGMAIPKGASGSWDEHSVFTPNILVAKDRYWLFYTAVPHPFINQGPDITKTAIGMAVSTSPDGPWEKLAANPVLVASGSWDDFDSLRVDDACLIVREGKYWLYYKGRQWNKGPGETKMGVAIADKPEGPYVKHLGNPIIPGNHEVLVWPQGAGVAALIGTVGPKEITRSILYSSGLRFKKTHDVVDVPTAAGAFRPEAFTESETREPIQWGLHIGKRKQFLPFIERFDLKELRR